MALRVGVFSGFSRAQRVQRFKVEPLRPLTDAEGMKAVELAEGGLSRILGIRP
jgi:hypothetical protein